MRWVFGPLLVIDVMLLLIALAFANMTAPGPARRALAHSAAILTEVDGFLEERYESLQLEAQQTQETTLTLPDYPLEITFTREEITSSDRGQFRALLLSRSGALLHDEGASAFRQDSAGEIDSISPQGAIRAWLNLLRPVPHRVFVGLTISFAVAAVVLGTALALSTSGWGRLVAISGSLLLATAPFLVLAIALRFALRVAVDGSDDDATRELLRLGQEIGWAPIRNGIIFTVGAGLMLGIGLLLTWESKTHAQAGGEITS